MVRQCADPQRIVQRRIVVGHLDHISVSKGINASQRAGSVMFGKLIPPRNPTKFAAGLAFCDALSCAKPVPSWNRTLCYY